MWLWRSAAARIEAVLPAVHVGEDHLPVLAAHHAVTLSRLDAGGAQAVHLLAVLPLSSFVIICHQWFASGGGCL